MIPPDSLGNQAHAGEAMAVAPSAWRPCPVESSTSVIRNVTTPSGIASARSWSTACSSPSPSDPRKNEIVNISLSVDEVVLRWARILGTSGDRRRAEQRKGAMRPSRFLVDPSPGGLDAADRDPHAGRGGMAPFGLRRRSGRDLPPGRRQHVAATSLEADDDVYYSVTPLDVGWLDQRTEWDAHFLNVPRDLRRDEDQLQRKGLLSVPQLWLGLPDDLDLQPDDDAVGGSRSGRSMDETKVAISNLTPPGNAADYVGNPSGPGDVWVKVQTDGVFSSSDADFLQLVVAK